jgi:hypothetical protein
MKPRPVHRDAATSRPLAGLPDQVLSERYVGVALAFNDARAHLREPRLSYDERAWWQAALENAGGCLQQHQNELTSRGLMFPATSKSR